MSSVFLRRRKRTKGVVWQVCFREGGRESFERCDSTWPTKSLAEERRMTILRAWAQGTSVPPIGGHQPERRTLAQVLEDYSETRRDVGEERHKIYRQTKARLGPLGGRLPGSVTPADVRGWVASLEALLSPSTIRAYLGVLKEVLDHAEVEPNPARHRSVRLPKQQRIEVAPPSTAEVAQLLGAITPRHRFALELIEGTGLRVSEVARLGWEDIDFRQARLRVSGTKTTSARRWVPIEPSLLTRISDLVPFEDRQGSLIPGFSVSTFDKALRRAAQAAGIAAYSAHDLRHRYISMLVQAGTPAPIAGRIVGHAKTSTTLDIYSHVLVDEHPARLAELRRIAVELVAGAGAGLVRADELISSPQNAENPARGRVLGEVEDTGIFPAGGPDNG